MTYLDCNPEANRAFYVVTFKSSICGAERFYFTVFLLNTNIRVTFLTLGQNCTHSKQLCFLETA